MSYILSTYAEFSDPRTAEQAVRALKAAGFDNIETDDLSHGLQTATDNCDAPITMSMRFSAVGAVIGGIFGVAWGLLVFGVPVTVLDVPYGAIIVLVGTLLCVAIGGVIGLEQAYVFSGRKSPDPTSIVGNHAVGVRVCAEAGTNVLRAREILNMFNEEPKPREERWWRLRRWAHALGT